MTATEQTTKTTESSMQLLLEKNKKLRYALACERRRGRKSKNVENIITKAFHLYGLNRHQYKVEFAYTYNTSGKLVEAQCRIIDASPMFNKDGTKVFYPTKEEWLNARKTLQPLGAATYVCPLNSIMAKNEARLHAFDMIWTRWRKTLKPYPMAALHILKKRFKECSWFKSIEVKNGKIVIKTQGLDEESKPKVKRFKGIDVNFIV